MTHKILFVEDDAELAQLMQGFLARHDLEVVIEPRGDTAHAALLREQPDLLLLDIMLPGKDGLTLCRELRPEFTGPIVILTSLDSDINQILGLELGANDYVLKTTPPAVLAARLRAQLRQHEQRQGGSNEAEGERLARDGSTLQLAGWAMAGVGAAALITSGVLFLSKGDAPAVTPQVSVTSSGASVGFTGGFP